MALKKRPAVPFLNPSKIKAEADNCRNKHWGNSIPVDIENIIEFKLGLEIRPVPNITQRSDIEAGISSNWKILFVDKDKYEDERRINHLRFSLAHEIGHLILHKEVFQLLGIKSVAGYYQFTEEKIVDGDKFHDYAETQASMFANMILVPREELLLRRNSLLKDKEMELKKLNIKDIRILNPYLVKQLADEFSVSEDVMRIALDNLEADLKDN